jgi:hypothetical protein
MLPSFQRDSMSNEASATEAGTDFMFYKVGTPALHLTKIIKSINKPSKQYTRSHPSLKPSL